MSCSSVVFSLDLVEKVLLLPTPLSLLIGLKEKKLHLLLV